MVVFVAGHLKIVLLSCGLVSNYCAIKNKRSELMFRGAKENVNNSLESVHGFLHNSKPAYLVPVTFPSGNMK